MEEQGEEGFHTYTLTKPIKRRVRDARGDIREEEITSIRLRTEITAGDLRATDDVVGDVAQSIALIAHLSGTSVADIDKLSAYDFRQLNRVCSGFSEPGLPTGETSSAT